MMWLSGGNFWHMQRPFMSVTMAAPATMTVLATLATFLAKTWLNAAGSTRFVSPPAQEVAAVAKGVDCVTACRIDSLEPLRVAFQFSGGAEQWSGACYDATDRIRGAELRGCVRPLDASETALLSEANAMFSGQVRHAPAWGGHWYGYLTRS